MRTTVNNINAALKSNSLPFEIVKGDCYFWFAATDDAPLGSEEFITSIYSNHLSEMSIADYVDHVKTGYNEFKESDII